MGKSIVSNKCILKPLFTKFLTLGLTSELCNPCDDWLGSTSSTNHQEDYKIRWVTRELNVGELGLLNSNYFCQVARAAI